jgi:hypothetical protein
MIDLESASLKVWEFVAAVGFVAVIIGVAGESAELIARWVERCRGKRLPKKIRRWILPVETIFFSLLVLGLAVEFFGSQKAQQIADRQNSILVSSNSVLAARLKETENFATRIRMNLITPRSWLFDDKKLISDLKDKPKGNAIIFTIPNDSGALVLATKLELALKQAGWSVSEPKQIDAGILVKRPEFESGISGIVKEETDARPMLVEHPKSNPDGSINWMDLWRTDTPTRALLAAMRDCGVFVGMTETEPSLPDNTVEIVIGINSW